jgi:hypothetical protein
MQDPTSETRLTEAQLGQVVTELSRLAQQREDQLRQGLDREQVIEVLKELELPVDLLDNAMEQLRQREALAKRRRLRNLRIVAGIAVLLVILGAIFFVTSRRAAIFSRISVDQDRITRTTDDGGNLSKVVRDGEDAVYHVVLQNVPINERLSLSCKWIDPSGRVFHENNWETRLTDKSTWPTSARCKIGPAAQAGTWTVEMSLRSRVLKTTTFQVE